MEKSRNRIKVKGLRYFFYVVLFLISQSCLAQFVVVLDPGHGGVDPGAIGPTKLYEKNVTLAIAKKVQELAKKDPNFTIKLTRSKDEYLSVSQRSEIARKLKANLLISIHADAESYSTASGASLWVLSNNRAKTELGRWLEQHEKQSELLGGAGTALSNADQDRYLSEAILDLQFAHANKVSSELAKTLLASLAQQTKVNKAKPEYASLGVLRAPDIPSVLVEVGFISNPKEEKSLRTAQFQQKIAVGIYNGIRRYVQQHMTQKNK